MKYPTHINDIDPRAIMRRKVELFEEMSADFMRDMERIYGPHPSKTDPCMHTEFRPGCPHCEWEYDHGGEDEDGN